MILLRKDLQPRLPRFAPGELVRHRRYHYRGVVVSVDGQCQASEGWYQANQTQPDRDQPWYHVLVHGSEMATYPAESSLEADDTDEPVVHPLVEAFFSSFVEGRHVRNDTPWPQTG